MVGASAVGRAGSNRGIWGGNTTKNARRERDAVSSRGRQPILRDLVRGRRPGRCVRRGRGRGIGGGRRVGRCGRLRSSAGDHAVNKMIMLEIDNKSGILPEAEGGCTV